MEHGAPPILGNHAVDAGTVCVITRFGLSNPLGLLAAYLEYRRVSMRASRSEGFLQAAFLIENPTTFYSVSMWSSAASISSFGGAVHEHAAAVRRVIGLLRMSRHGGPELWSTQWRLASVSHNLRWRDFVLVPGTELSRPDEAGSEER